MFDVVIGNPPFNGKDPDTGKNYFMLAAQFVKLSLALINDGIIAFIMPNYWIRKRMKAQLSSGHHIHSDVGSKIKKHFPKQGSTFTMMIWQNKEGIDNTLCNGEPIDIHQTITPNGGKGEIEEWEICRSVFDGDYETVEWRALNTLGGLDKMDYPCLVIYRLSSNRYKLLLKFDEDLITYNERLDNYEYYHDKIEVLEQIKERLMNETVKRVIAVTLSAGKLGGNFKLIPVKQCLMS